MLRARCRNPHSLLYGQTALVHPNVDQVRRMIKVQIDDINHPWSHNWHEQPECDWECLNVKTLEEMTFEEAILHVTDGKQVQKPIGIDPRPPSFDFKLLKELEAKVIQYFEIPFSVARQAHVNNPYYHNR